jgi:hypothetical protein
MADLTTVEQQNGACFVLEGRTFVSTNGAIAVHAKDNNASEMIWSQRSSEVIRVECRGHAIIASGDRVGTFDPATQTLIWAGETYTPAP